MGVGRPCSALVGGASSLTEKTLHLDISFSFSTPHLELPASENLVALLSRHIPKGNLFFPSQTRPRHFSFFPLVFLYLCSRYNRMAALLVITVHNRFKFYGDRSGSEFTILTEDHPGLFESANYMCRLKADCAVLLLKIFHHQFYLLEFCPESWHEYLLWCARVE